MPEEKRGTANDNLLRGRKLIKGKFPPNKHLITKIYLKPPHQKPNVK